MSGVLVRNKAYSPKSLLVERIARMRKVLASASILLLFLLCSSALCSAEEYYILDTEEAYTVGQGVWRTEVEVGVTKQPDASELYTIPRVRVTYGLSDWADIEFDYAWLAVQGTDFFDSSSGVFKDDHDDFGTGDLRIRLKVVPYEFGRHRLGFDFITKLPNASQDSGLGTNETDFTSEVLLSSDWGRLRTHMNVGFAVLGDPFTDGNQRDHIVWGVGGDYSLTESLTLMGEVEGSFEGEHGEEGFIDNIAECSEGPARARVRLGLTGPMGANWRWGMSAFKGVNSHTEDWGVQVGMSRTWETDRKTAPRSFIADESKPSDYLYNPMKTEEAYTIADRQFLTEVAVGYMSQPDGSDLYLLPDLTLGWGLGSWADVQFEFQYLMVNNTERYMSGVAGPVETGIDNDGAGDVRVKFKASPFEFKYGRLGAQLVTKVPSADDDDALGTDEADVTLKALLSTDWKDFFGDSALGRLKTHLNAGIAIQSDRFQVTSQNDYFVWGAAAEYQLLPALIVWSEVEGSTGGDTTVNISQGDVGNSYAEARVGLSGPVRVISFLEDWQWGAALSAGLNDHSRDWTASLGLSRTWGR
jgi:hypothetical protein